MDNKLHRPPLFTTTEQKGYIYYIWSDKYTLSPPLPNGGGGGKIL